MSNAVASNVLVDQQLASNSQLNRNNQTNDNLTCQQKYFKSSQFPNIKRPGCLVSQQRQPLYHDLSETNTNEEYCTKFADKKHLDLQQPTGSKRVSCMRYTDLSDSVIVGGQLAGNFDEHSGCQCLTSNNNNNNTNNYQQQQPELKSSTFNQESCRPQPKHNTDDGKCNDGDVLIYDGVGQLPNNSEQTIIIEQTQCELIPRAGRQQTTNKVPARGGATGLLETKEEEVVEGEDSDEDFVLDYETVLSKILNEKKLALSNSTEVLRFLHCNRQRFDQKI